MDHWRILVDFQVSILKTFEMWLQEHFQGLVSLHTSEVNECLVDPCYQELIRKDQQVRTL